MRLGEYLFCMIGCYNLSQMTDKEFAGVTNIMDEVLTDGKTSAKPIAYTMSTANERQHPPGRYERTNLKEPTMIVAFPRPGMVGSITANYIIEHLHMHEIAFVESEFIIPGIIYIGGKLRHPFRVYANDDGTICVILCEIPILAAGIYSVLNTCDDRRYRIQIKVLFVQLTTIYATIIIN